MPFLISAQIMPDFKPNIPEIYMNSVEHFNSLHGVPTRNKLVTVIDMTGRGNFPEAYRIHYGLYAIFLKSGHDCSVNYDLTKCDYQEGAVVTFAPGQTIDIVVNPDALPSHVTAILFHPDLIYGTTLGHKIHDFAFFDYSQTEAVHLSKDEKKIFLDTISTIDRELDREADAHTPAVIATNIQLLLEHLNRFYDRQFMTRHTGNSEIVRRFERMLMEHYRIDAGRHTLPTVNDFASAAHLSSKYFSEVIKRELGVSPKSLIMQRVINVAKQRLASTSDNVSIIAFDLGFEYPGHFTRMFRQITGMSPSEYRNSVAR